MSYDPWGGSWGLHWEGWLLSEEGALEITGVGGIESEEALGAPSVFAISMLRGGVYRRPWIPERPALQFSHPIMGVGGIAGAEAFGGPTITTIRPRKKREAEIIEWLIAA